MTYREIYRSSALRRLIVEVAVLSRELQRPVCVTDLKDYFRRYPQRRPQCPQRLGLQLARATRAADARGSRLHRVGTIGAQAYYAYRSTPQWESRLAAYQAIIQAGVLLRLHLPDHALYLIGTPHEPTGVRALNGFWREAQPLLGKLPSGDPLHSSLTEQLDSCRELLCESLVLDPPSRLLPKEEAKALLLREAQDRRESEYRLSLFRYLARWRWPQSTLFPAEKRPVYLEEQLRWLCASQWPYPDEDPLMAKALLLCSRYGLTPPD